MTGKTTENPQKSDAGLRRVRPSTNIFSWDYLVMQPLIDWLEHVAPEYLSGSMLDYGCGNKPYKTFFEHRLTKYTGVDLEQNVFGSVDVVIKPGDPLPFVEKSFDCAISTQVLEHVPNPDAYLSEVARVLKPGAYLIVTCPGSWMLHEEPYDFFRYTKYGLAHLMQKHGFEVVRIDEGGGAWRLIGQTILNHISFGKKFKIKIVSGVLSRIWIPLTNILFLALDKYNTNRKDTVNYMVIAKRV